MTKTTKSKTNNYWGYIIFAALILLYIPFADDIWNASNTTARTNNRPDKQIQTENQDQKQITTTNNKSNKRHTATLNYCELSSAELQKQLTSERHYTLNGYGYVNFTQRFDRGRNQWVENQIMISGNGKRLTGNWKLLSNNRVSIFNLMVTGGSYDASNNSRTRGMFIIQCSGNLKGTLVDRNGNTRDILIQKSR